MHVDKTILEPKGWISTSYMRLSTWASVIAFWWSVDIWPPETGILSGAIQETSTPLCKWKADLSVLLTLQRFSDVHWRLQMIYHFQCTLHQSNVITMPLGMFRETWFQIRKDTQWTWRVWPQCKSYSLQVILGRLKLHFGCFFWFGVGPDGGGVSNPSLLPS